MWLYLGWQRGPGGGSGQRRSCGRLEFRTETSNTTVTTKLQNQFRACLGLSPPKHSPLLQCSKCCFGASSRKSSFLLESHGLGPHWRPTKEERRGAGLPASTRPPGDPTAYLHVSTSAYLTAWCKFEEAVPGAWSVLGSEQTPFICHFIGFLLKKKKLKSWVLF